MPRHLEPRYCQTIISFGLNQEAEARAYLKEMRKRTKNKNCMEYYLRRTDEGFNIIYYIQDESFRKILRKTGPRLPGSGNTSDWKPYQHPEKYPFDESEWKNGVS